MLTAIYLNDEWGRDILLFETREKAEEWLSNYFLARNERPEQVDYFMKSVDYLLN